MVGRIVLRRVFGAVGKVSSEAGEAPSARSIGVRCNAGRPLLLSTALGTGILVGAAGLTLGSTQALAGCTPGLFSGAIELCGGTDSGISATVTNDQVVVFGNEHITTDGVYLDAGINSWDISLAVSSFGGLLPVKPIVNNDGGAGVTLLSDGGDLVLGTIPGATITGDTYGVDMETTGAGTITMTIGDDVYGDTEDGIYAETVDGNISITTDAGTDVSTGDATTSYGIHAVSSGGSIGITTNGTVSEGGIDATTIGSGTVTITANDDVTTTTGDAIYAQGVNGLIKVTANGNIDADSDGIGASSSGSGNIEIVTGANSAIAAGGDGINAYSTGTGAITITSNGTIGTSGFPVGDDGIQAEIQNAANGSAISITANKSVYADYNGIIASTTGTGNVDVTAGASTVISGANSAGISATGAGGTVTVTANGTSITGATDGIYAQNTTGNIVVDVNSGTVTGTGSGGEGIYATTGGTGTITITQDEGTTVNSTSDDGIEAVSTGTGLIHITSNGTITAGNNGGDDGITAIGLAGGAPITIDFGTGNVDASITAAGNGIEAQTSGTGKITVNAKGTIANAAGNLGPNAGTLQNNESGIWTKQTGTGDIEINTGTKSISAGNGQYDYGIYAQAAGGAIDITTGTGTVTGGDDGIHAEVLSGNGNIDITTGGEVASLTGIGIFALSTSNGTGDITVTNNGTVGNSTTATASSGIVAMNTSLASSGNVTVNVNKSVYADGFYGVAASTLGSGDAKIIVAGNVTIDPTGYGAYAYSAGGNASVTTNDGDTVTVGGSGAVGLYARSDKLTGADTAVVTTGNNGLVTVTGGNAIGIEVINRGSGTGSVKVDTATNGGANGTALAVSGDQAIGILAATADPTLLGFNGSGDVTVTTGAGNITVTGGTTISAPTVGIAALTNGGNIAITTGTGAINVSGSGNNTVGIYANTGRENGAANGSGTVTIATHGTITTSGGNGIEAYSHDGNLNVDTYAAIDAAGDRGIYADANGTGNVTVVTHTGSTIGGNANDGIVAESDLSGTGNVSVTINDAIGTSGNHVGNNGIEANVLNGSSSGTVTVVANASIYATNDGIAASNAGSGTVDVTAGASTVIDATNGAGISATGAGGTVTVTANGTSITGATDGIYAENTTGNIVVDVNSGTVTGTGSGGEGIYATTGGTGTITITQDAGTTVNSTSDDGIEAVSAGTGLIHITSNGTITAGNNGGDDGITAIGLTGGAPITIDFGTGNVAASITAAGNGIEAQTSGNGAISITALGTIANAAGSLGANGGTLQNNESGIWAKQTGAGNISITTGTKSISAGNGQYDYGIYAQAATGSVTITTGTGTVTGGDDGIHVEVLSGSATATVTANGNVTSAVGSAIDVASDTGNISITNYGAATSSIDPVVNAATNGGNVTVNNKAGGSIAATGVTPAWDALAIQTSTGAGTVTVQNDGNITGRVDFNLASTGGATFNNTANTWYTSGVNNFTAGNDTLTNTSTGDIHTSGTTTFAFGAGTDAVNNAGDFFVSGDTSFTGLEAFNNSGILDLSTDHTVTTDTVTIDGAFNGTGVSELVLDAALGWPASADLLTVGSTTGSTAIRINNVASGFGAWLGSDFVDGILLVDGSSSAASFHLDTTQELYDASIDALDAGLFNYKLVFNSGQERLISLPGEEASQLPTFLTAAQSIWYDTSPWLDRQADLRDQLKGGEGSVTPGIWGKALGRWASRDLSQTVSAGGTSLTNNVDYDQDTYGFVAGVDTGSSNVLGQGDTLLGGVSAGYVTSDQNFKTSPTTAEYKGAVLGVYGTYLKGGFFIDAMAKANLLTMDYKAPSLGGATASPDVKSYGVEVDAGQRFPLSDSAFIEPLASLTYAKTQIDTFSVANSQFDFQDATSFRGSLGLRGGATAYQSSETKVDLSLTGRLWNEFEGDNKMVIRSGGPDLTMTDKFDGTFGEVVGSVNIFGLGDGLSGFVNGGAKFKSNYTSGELTAGIRYEW